MLPTYGTPFRSRYNLIFFLFFFFFFFKAKLLRPLGDNHDIIHTHWNTSLYDAFKQLADK